MSDKIEEINRLAEKYVKPASESLAEKIVADFARQFLQNAMTKEDEFLSSGVVVGDPIEFELNDQTKQD